MCFTDCSLTRIDEIHNRHISFQTLLRVFNNVLELMSTATLTYMIFYKMEHMAILTVFISKHLPYFAIQRSFRLIQFF